MLFKYWAPELVAELLALPTLLNRINRWTAQRHNGDVFWHGELRFNYLRYRATGGGWHVSWRPFGGCGTVWVERWIDGVKVDSKKFALHQRYELHEERLKRVDR